MNDTANTNPYVFLVGCPRSGTTLLERVLAAHPQLTMIHETHWIPHFYRLKRGLTDEGMVTPKLLRRLSAHRRWAKLGITDEQLEALKGDSPVHYSTFVSGIFDLWAHREGKPLVGEKTPHYVRYIPLLHELWPRARFVHIIRDGRDVALSAIPWGKAAQRYAPYDSDPVGTTALWWEWHVRLGREAGAALGPDLYREVRYEDLTRASLDVCRELSDFLGLPFSEEMVGFHQGKTRDDPGLSAKNAWLPITSGLRDWRSQMSVEDAGRFGTAAGTLLSELDFDPGPEPSESDRLTVTESRSSLLNELLSEGHDVPSSWATDSLTRG